MVEAQCTWWSGQPDDDPSALAEQLFGVRAWTTPGRPIRTRLVAATGELADGGDRALADAFEIGAASVAHVRRDPLLPEQLGESASTGAVLRAAYRDYEGEFSTALRTWFKAHA